MADPENYQYDIDVSEVVSYGRAVLLLVLGYLTLPAMDGADRGSQVRWGSIRLW